MADSAQQTRNLDDSLAIIRSDILAVPVLLVDDVTGSRWAFAVAAWRQREHRGGEIWPPAH